MPYLLGNNELLVLAASPLSMIRPFVLLDASRPPMGADSLLAAKTGNGAISDEALHHPRIGLYLQQIRLGLLGQTCGHGRGDLDATQINL